LSLANLAVPTNLGIMHAYLKYPAIALLCLFVARTALPLDAHQAPVKPENFVLNVGVEGAGSYQISMWIPAGSTSDSVPGIAHVLEHLKFKNRDGIGFTGFDAIAGSSSNASTTYRSTRYDLNVPPAGVSKALETLATMRRPLSITDADLKLEKSIVQQELFQRMQGDPDTPFYQEFYSALYAGLPYENPPGGTQESVASAAMKDVLAFDAAHYQGSKIFLLIAGPPLNAVNRSAIEQYFPNAAIGNLSVDHKLELRRDDVELQAMPALLSAVKIAELSASEFKREKTSPRARNIKLTVSKIISAPTSWRAMAAASILQDAIRSRLPEGLQERIAEDNRLVQDFSVSVSRLMDGIWQIDFSAAIENSVAPEAVRAAFEKYFAELSATGLSQKSFERLKARNFLVSEWESAEGRTQSLASDSIMFGYDKAISYRDELQQTKIEDVNDLLKTLQMPGRVGVLLLKPEGAMQ
jgi:predicted Zn-dependent peptidase